MNKKIIVLGISTCVLLITTSFGSALSDSNEQPVERLINNISDETESLGLSNTTIHVRVFGWHPEIGGSPYTLEEANVKVRILGLAPRILLGSKVVGTWNTGHTYLYNITLPAPSIGYWYYWITASKPGYKPCLMIKFVDPSFRLLKLKAGDNPEQIWLTLLGITN